MHTTRLPVGDPRHGVPAGVDTGCECTRCARCRTNIDRFFKASRMGAPLFRVTRRVQALRAIGYTPTQLAAAFTMSPDYVEWLTHTTTGHVTRTTFARVAAGYEPLSGHPQGTVADPRWPSPLAWDEPTDPDHGHRLDDPNGRPRFDAPRPAVYGPKCHGCPHPSCATGNGPRCNLRKCAHQSCAEVGKERRHDSVDPATITRVMAGDLVSTTRAEKEAVVDAWLAAGRTWASLERLTGWQIENYRKNRHRQTKKESVAA